jgi:hypothetical protein
MFPPLVRKAVPRKKKETFQNVEVFRGAKADCLHLVERRRSLDLLDRGYIGCDTPQGFLW